ncbi:MAG: glycogen/starch synthase [bacterium]|nr:glycogen/starch synthase [bacterium]
MQNTKKLNIIHVASEVDPFSKSGGLADVTRSLSKAQKRLGHDVCLITPLYEQLIDKKKHGLKLIEKNIEIVINSKDTVKVNFYRGYLMHGLPVYFVENNKYFCKRKTLYGSTHENARFMVFNVAALRLINMLKLQPDIIHCHDWMAGLIPFYIKTKFHYTKDLSKTKTLYTIHNLVFQFGQNWWEVPPKLKDYGKSKLPSLDDKNIEYINFAKRAIMSADAINTVSENYAQEIMTKKFGQDLHHILKNRQHKVFGIINGIDYHAYNPATDNNIYKKYNAKSIHGKKNNKKYLQQKFGLNVDNEVALISMTSRIVFQKGFELLLKIAEQILKLNIQLIVIGAGDKDYIKKLERLAKHYPKRLVVIPSHEQNQKYETLIYAGSDMLLLPSHHEPCGLNQMIAMRYGCVPIVHKVGGLYDTVVNYSVKNNTGTGFVFNNFDTYELYGAIIKALENFKNAKHWRQIVIRDLQQSNSWEIPAKKYLSLYKKIINGNEKK